MKIDAVSNSLTVYRVQRNEQNGQGNDMSAGIRRLVDTLEISKASELMASSRPLAEVASKELDADIEARIAELKQAVDNGTYFVSSDKLAEALLSSLR